MMNTKAILLVAWTIATVAAAKAARDPTGYIRENFDATNSERFGHRINPQERPEDCRGGFVNKKGLKHQGLVYHLPPTGKM